MKKQYEKPAMYFENYSLSQSIAAGCNVPTGMGYPTAVQNSCGWDFGNMTVWAAGMAGCNTLQTSLDTPYESACYNNPENMLALFSVS